MLKLLGNNELAVRLPAALFALASCLLLWWFFTKKYKDPLVAIVAPLVLVCTQGYVTIHGVRTGDYDSCLTFFTTAFIFFFYVFLQEKNYRYFWLATSSIILAALTKGIQPLIFLPPMLLYAAGMRNLMTIIRSPHTYAGIFLFILVVPGYYLLREQYNHGYIAAVIENELWGRYTKTVESHTGTGWTNLGLLVNDYFTPWYQMVIPAAFLGVFSKKRSEQHFMFYLLGVALFYLFIISNAKTQVWWYLVPLYPLLATAAAVFVVYMVRIIVTLKPLALKANWLLPAVFVLLVFAAPYTAVIRYVYANPVNIYSLDEEKDMAKLMKQVLHHQVNIEGYTIVNEYFDQAVTWYTRVFYYDKWRVSFANKEELPTGTRAITYFPETLRYVETHYHTHIIERHGHAVIYEIEGKR